MGEEAPESLQGCLGELPPVGCDELGTKGSRTSTVLGEKIYVVGGSIDDGESSINIRVFNKLTSKWMIPTVLGPKPTPSKGHSAILLNSERILILKGDCSVDDSTWFLEVDTPYVKEQSKLLGTEVVAWSKGVIGDGALPVVITGPSGVGKGTLISKLVKEFPSTFGFSVSHTTRAPREKEINRVHYNFTERIIMENDIRDGKFLEFASVHGNLYGTSVEAVEAVKDVGKRCILDIDVQGARSVRASPLEALFVFICPPSFEELEKRLRARGTESEEQVQKRLRNAIAEIDQRNSAGLFDHILVNDDLESCYQELKKLLVLEDGIDASYQHSVKNLRIPLNPSLSKAGQNIMVCSMSDLGIECPLVFDVSSLKGGAPGRTRGMNIGVFDS